MQDTVAEHFGKLKLLLAEGRRRIGALHFHGKLVIDENFPAGDEPLHICGLDVVGIEKKAARPYHRRGAVTEAAEFLVSQFRGMLQFAFTVIDVSLARPAFKEHRDGQELLSLFDGAQQARRGTFADVPLAVEEFVVSLPGRNKVKVDVELVALDTDLAVDERATAGMIGEAEGDPGFVSHGKFLSYRNSSEGFQFKPFKDVPVVQAVKKQFEPLERLEPMRLPRGRQRSLGSGCRSPGIFFLYRKYPACARPGLPRAGSPAI